jgi:putative SOS response-associated peptidase YedK
MCGRFTLRAPASVIAEQFALFEVPGFAARFNIAPTQPAPVVRRRGKPLKDGGRTAARSSGDAEHVAGRSSSISLSSNDWELTWLRWGLIPGWAKDAAIGARLINARAESAAAKPAFRAAMRSRRCLVIADGFYEWQRAGRSKRPHFIRLRDDRPFAFAGLWESWQGDDAGTVESCAILTTEANELIRSIHDRMPVILSPGDYAAWLDPAIDDPQRLAAMLVPYSSDAMQADPVSDFVNTPAHDSPRCVERMLPKGNIPFPGWE